MERVFLKDAPCFIDGFMRRLTDGGSFFNPKYMLFSDDETQKYG